MSTPARRSATDYAIPLIRRIIAQCPRRVTGSESERRAQHLLCEEFEAVGLEPEFHSFRYNRSLYANLALHFGLAVVATIILALGYPVVAMVLHLLCAISYWGDSTRRFLLLRRLFPFHASQNLIGTLPATKELRRRVVVIAHADAAYTGALFHPQMIKRSKDTPHPLYKSLQVATVSVFLLAAVDVVVMTSGPSWPVWVAANLLTLPALIATLLNLQVVFRNQIVPGANDNLTGCAATVMLAERLGADKPDDVELVFVCTGAEESSTGGALALAREMRWSPEDTVIVGVDGMTNGELDYLVEGEVVGIDVDAALVEAIGQVNARFPEMRDVQGYEVPNGATDVVPFLARGFSGVCLACIDHDIGAPRHYHWPTDTPDNLDADQFDDSVAFAEAFVRELIGAEGANPAPSNPAPSNQ